MRRTRRAPADGQEALHGCQRPRPHRRDRDERHRFGCRLCGSSLDRPLHREQQLGGPGRDRARVDAALVRRERKQRDRHGELRRRRQGRPVEEDFAGLLRGLGQEGLVLRGTRSCIEPHHCGPRRAGRRTPPNDGDAPVNAEVPEAVVIKGCCVDDCGAPCEPGEDVVVRGGERSGRHDHVHARVWRICAVLVPRVRPLELAHRGQSRFGEGRQ